MSEAKKAPKRKIIDWNKKSGEDASRITKRMQHRNELKDSATTTNDAMVKTPPKATGLPLLRLRKKIKEVYDEEDDEYTPLFNINLIDKEEDELHLPQKKANETLSITKQQQLTGKLNLIMNTALTAEEAGLSSQITAKDAYLASTAEYDLKKLRRKTVKEKIEKPAGLTGEVTEKQLPQAIKGIKKAKQKLPKDALEGFPAENTDELIELDEEDMAKLILKKSGRRGPKKKLSEIAKGLNQFKDFEDNEANKKE